MSQAEIIPTARVHSFPPLAYKNVPVLTTEMLAQAYEVEAKQIRQNFANNKERFIEGKHFFSVSGQELKTFLLCVENFDSQISPKVRILTLWTDRGCARHAKSLNTDTAWDMYELLEETFFAVAKPEQTALPSSDTLTPEQQAQLQAIVAAKAGMVPASHRRRAFQEIWARFNNNFQIARYAQLPPAKIGEAVEYLVGMEVKALKKLPAADAYALPTPEPRFPLYRNGRFYPPHYKRKHAPGPRETALMDFWKNEYNARVAELEDKFRALMDGLDAALGNLYPHAVADLGRDADTMFSVSCVLEGMYAARDMAQTSFKEALSKTRLHMRMATSVAVALGQ